MSSYEREDYLLTISDIKNNGRGLKLIDAMKAIQEAFDYKMKTTQLDSGMQIKQQKEIDEGKLTYAEANKKRKSKVKKFNKIKCAFNTALSNAIKNLEAIQNVDDLVSTLDQIISLSEKVEQNIEANKMINEAKKVTKELQSYRSKLSKEAVRCIKRTEEMYRKVNGFNSYFEDFDKLSNSEAYFSQTVLKEMKNISKIDNQAKKDSLKDDIKKIEEKIEETYKDLEQIAEKELNELFNKISQVEEKTIGMEDKKLKTEVKAETKAIRRVMKPKTMSISKENLEKMKKSEQLSEDVELIQDRMSTIGGIGNFGLKSSIVRKKVISIKNMMNKVLISENNKHSILNQEQLEIDRKTSFSDEAAFAYETIVEQSKNQQEASRNASIENNQLESKKIDMAYERGKLTESHGKDVESGYEVIGGDVRTNKIKIDNSKEINAITENINELEKKQKQNKQEAEELKQEKISIPEKYKNMKKKLQEMSNMKKAVSSHSMGGIKL